MATTPKDDKPDTSAEIAAEATPAPAAAKPAGSPSMAPITALRRRVRADFRMALIKDIPPSMLEGAGDGNVELDVDLSEPGMLQFAMAYMANLEDAYRIVAVDKDAYDRWVKEASDEDLTALHEWYQARYPMGEAPASLI